MRSHRTTARGLLFLLLLGASIGTANAAEVPARTAFPVVGNVTFTNDWHDSRPGGWHEGNDLMTVRHQPAIAFEAGRVEKIGSGDGRSCWLILNGRSGVEYWYIHLNNDLGPGNDNDGGCRNRVSWAPGLRNGEFVRRGELVGYVGDSGDADGIQPHLHFELHNPGPVNPYQYLLKAKRMLYPRPDGTGEISLAFWRARVVKVGDGAMTIRTSWISVEPNRWGYPYSRSVTLTVPPEAVVLRRTADGPEVTELDQSAEGQRARVRTVSFTSSWKTQRARPGALVAKRIYLLGSG